MGIKTKIFSGFIILAVMLAIAGVWSIFQVRSIGSTVESVLDKKFSTVASVKKMKDSLEREDSGTLMTLLGNPQKGSKIINTADSVFITSLNHAKTTATNENEQQLLSRIEKKYTSYIKTLNAARSFLNENDKLDWYTENAHSQFIAVMELVDNFMVKNDQTIFETSKNIIDKSHRAIMPGVVAIIASLVFAILFHSLVSYYFVNPIMEITKRIRKFTSKRTPYDYKVESKDEINDLNEAVDILCSHVLAEEKTR